MRDKILDEIKAVVSARAKTSGYTMVVDSAAEGANGTPVYLYNNGENDITDDILKQLNSTAPVPDGNTPAPSTN
jgi:Skp family chaperone for outer membrane proteins